MNKLEELFEKYVLAVKNGIDAARPSFTEDNFMEKLNNIAKEASVS